MTLSYFQTFTYFRSSTRRQTCLPKKLSTPSRSLSVPSGDSLPVMHSRSERIFLLAGPSQDVFLLPLQCDQIGPFLKDRGDKFSYKSSPNIKLLLGFLENCEYSGKNGCGEFLLKLGYFLIHHLVTLFRTSRLPRYSSIGRFLKFLRTILLQE